jgi:acetyl-CoA carboxylase biotin carboxylase subunit
VKNFPSNRRTSSAAATRFEIRINAEDPDHDFRGSPGTITKLRLPGGPGVRFDSHVYEGYRIPPFYDSMIGKLIIYRPTRAEAIATCRRALDEFVIEGVKTTIPLAKRILRDPNFVAGTVHTKYVEQSMLNS